MHAHNILFTFVFSLAAVSKAQISPGVFFSNLGGAGSYPQVVYQPNGTWPTCDVANPCQQETVNIPAHNLAPFDEEVSLQLRGPLNMVRIAIYQPVQGQYKLVSNWQPGVPSSNMTFLMNCGLDWSICQGNSLGYANELGTESSPFPVDFNGVLAAGLELTVMSGDECNGDCGWYRGTGYHAWAGDKIFVVETSMPFSDTASDVPAVWSLNAKIPRTGQYGCNCGRSGCGEFDIAEVITNGATEAYQTMYSYNGNLGSPGYFPRPTNGPSTYVVHYSIADNRIYVINVPGGCFQYSEILNPAYIAALHSVTVDVNLFGNAPNTNLVGTCPSAPPAVVPTSAPITHAPATATPTTHAPTTHAPTTVAPKTTHVPTTHATTKAPTTTHAPTTHATTHTPTTHLPTTKAPTTHPPTTKAATTQAKTTHTPTTRSPTTVKAPTGNLCGSSCSCCSDALLGPVCYDPTLYVCASETRLCPSGNGVCSNDCYELALYTCVNGALQQKL